MHVVHVHAHCCAAAPPCCARRQRRSGRGYRGGYRGGYQQRLPGGYRRRLPAEATGGGYRRATGAAAGWLDGCDGSTAILQTLQPASRALAVPRAPAEAGQRLPGRLPRKLPGVLLGAAVAWMRWLAHADRPCRAHRRDDLLVLGVARSLWGSFVAARAGSLWPVGYRRRRRLRGAR
jgi:hypothetical protein